MREQQRDCKGEDRREHEHQESRPQPAIRLCKRRVGRDPGEHHRAFRVADEVGRVDPFDAVGAIVDDIRATRCVAQGKDQWKVGGRVSDELPSRSVEQDDIGLVEHGDRRLRRRLDVCDDRTEAFERDLRRRHERTPTLVEPQGDAVLRVGVRSAFRLEPDELAVAQCGADPLGLRVDRRRDRLGAADHAAVGADDVEVVVGRGLAGHRGEDTLTPAEDDVVRRYRADRA